MDLKIEPDDYEEETLGIEPVIVIKDEDTDDEYYDGSNDQSYHESDPLMVEYSLPDYVKRIGPEISVTPIWKVEKQSQEIPSEKYYRDTQNNKYEYTNVVNGRTREKVRKISRDEALNAEDTYTKRKSSPLEMCPICKKYFRRMKSHMVQHERAGKGVARDNRLICTICRKSFNTPSNLAIHMRSHTGDRPYVCDICYKTFSQSCNLINHRRVHTGERPYKCPHCDRAFTQSGNLTNHIRLHTDEKPFKCHFCDKACAQSGNLDSHIRNNHKALFNMFALSDTQ